MELAARVSEAREVARARGYGVRPAEVTDAAGIADVHVRVWRATYAELMSRDYLARMDPEVLARGWRSLLEAQGTSVRTFVVTDPHRHVVGFASAGPTRDEGGPAPQELYAINVAPNEHGTGVAQLLMDAVVEPGACSLWVAVGNHRATAFYRKYGFVDDAVTMTDERSGVVEQRMVRPASPR